ncbi:MAG: transporter [Deltaproteobacteria bacterium]|nr:transporter [Deltaproteobacteria bacterium]
MIMNMLYTLVLAFVVFVLVSQVNADPIQGVSARTQFFSGTALRSFVRVIREANGDQNLHVVQIPTILGYNLATDAVVNVVVPYVIKEFKSPDKRRLDARGVGDISLFGKYRLYREDVPRGSTQFSLIGGLELPTGDTTQRKDGVKLPPPLQLGSGGVDPLLGLAASWISAFHALEGGVQFKYNSRHDGFRFGTVTNYDLAYAYQLYPKWPIENAQLGLLLEFNGEHRERNILGGNKASASGGDTIFLSPGIQYIFLDNALVETSFQVPVLDRVNGKQLHQDYRVLFGFRILF